MTRLQCVMFSLNLQMCESRAIVGFAVYLMRYQVESVSRPRLSNECLNMMALVGS